MKKILTAGLSPAVQKIILLDQLEKGEVNRSTEYIIDAAGKSINTCRVLIQAGLNAEALVPIGEESMEMFTRLCSKDSIPLIASETAGRVRTCYTLIDMNEKSSTEIVVNEPETITAEEEKAFCKAFTENLKGTGCLVISGSRLKGFSDAVIPFMIEECSKRDISLLADYKGSDLKNSFISEKIRPDFVKINKTELLQTFGEVSSSERQIIKELSKKYNNTFIITSGEEPTLISQSGDLIEMESIKLEAVNPIGCGDSFNAGIAEGIIRNLSLQKTAEKGRDYAAKNALSLHPGWIKIKEV